MTGGFTLRFGDDMPKILLVGRAQHVRLQGVEIVAHEVLLIQPADQRLERHAVAVQVFGEMGCEELRIIGGIELPKKFGQLDREFIELVPAFQVAQQRHQALGFHFAVFGSADEDEPVEQAQHGLIDLGRGIYRVPLAQALV